MGAMLLAATLAAPTVLPAGSLQAQVDLELAEAPGRPDFGEAIDGAREAVEARMEELGIPGISVAVRVAAEQVWAEGFGWANVPVPEGVDEWLLCLERTLREPKGGRQPASARAHPGAPRSKRRSHGYAHDSRGTHR